jgi:hypothetical protein
LNLKKKKTEYESCLKQREYQRYQIYMTVDLDHIVGGYPDLWVLPKNSVVKFKMPLTFNFSFVKKGESNLFSALSFRML